MVNNYSWLATNDKNARRINIEEEKHNLRSEFQRDRDRILYSRAFRRLSGKTQVFLAGNDDHIRTRLTHTLEVAQISRTIAKALSLNEELTEAIALGHDIGHTPFGHVGERMLNSIMNGCYKIRDFNAPNSILNGMRGFKHNWQSIRVATELEGRMNLTDYTLWGMLNHSNKRYKKCKMKGENDKCLFRHLEEKCSVNLESEKALSFYRNISIYEKISDKWSFEGLIVKLADEIAQRHHDIEDALEYGIIGEEELYNKLDEIFNFDLYREKIKNYIDEKDLMEEFFKSIEEHEKNFGDIKKSIEVRNVQEYKAKFSKFIVNLLATDVIYNSRNNFDKLIKEFKISGKDDFYNKRNNIKNYEQMIVYSKYIKESDKKLGVFLKDRILNSYKAQIMDGVGQHVIKELFKAYIMNPQQLPDKIILKLFKNLKKYNGKIMVDINDDNFKENNVGYLRNILAKYHYNQLDKNEEYCYDYNYYKVQLLRTVCDYISGMTDMHAIEEHRKLYNIK